MPPDYPARFQELCRAHGILRVNDEVGSGVGVPDDVVVERYAGAEPDIMVSGSRSVEVFRSRVSPAVRRSWTPCRPEGSAALSGATRSRVPQR